MIGGVNPTDSRPVLKTRMALVGHNCMVSRFPDGVSVGTGVKGLSNLCDENLDNYCVSSQNCYKDERNRVQ